MTLFDIHSHILPMLDDGSSSLEESVEMLDGMAELGYATIAATPHFDVRHGAPGIETQRHLIDRICELRQGRSPEIVTGGEVIFDELFVEAEEAGAVPSIGLGRTYLIEFGFHPGSVPPSVEELTFKLKVRGIALILAHPERCPDLRQNHSRLDLIRNSGVIVQVNLMSIVGRYGEGVRRNALSLIESGRADIVSTDLHGPRDVTLVRQAIEELRAWDDNEFLRLASSNPRLVLDGRQGELSRHV